MELIGFDLAPFPDRQSDPATLPTLLMDSSRIAELADWQSPAPSAVTVLRVDELTYAMVPGLSGHLPWIPGDAADEAAPESGYVSRQQMTASEQSFSEGAALREATALASKLRHAFVASQGSAQGSAGQTPQAPAEQQGGEAGGDEQQLIDAFREKYPEIAMSAGANLLAAGLNGGSLLNPTALLNGLSGGLLSVALGFGLEKVFGKPEPGDSTAKWAQVLVGPQLFKLLFTTGNVGKLIGGAGPYDDAALRVGDVDEKGNEIRTGLPSVLIEGVGKSAARQGDAVQAGGVVVKKGVMQVLIGGQPAARADAAHPGYGSSSKAGRFLEGASQTYIGGAPTFDPNDPSTFPPIPDDLREQGKSMPDGEPPNCGAHDPSMDKPDSAGYYFDITTGEWRLWDPKGSGGWSLTSIEYSNLTDWGIFKSPFEVSDSPSILNRMLNALGLAQSEQRGNWYLLGGLIDLGSPWRPGAGAAQAWFIPDSMFGMDFKPYFNLHDWRFSPTSASLDTWHGWWDQIVRTEVPSYLAGAAGQELNPLGQAAQLIYSLTTTIVGYVEWSEMREGVPNGIPR
ncbi:MAG: hypothetical protein JNK87_11830 [Bryobacterales bacterium]|nr:hypothetical protein [Bryobacterales bacterium]